MGEIAEFEDKRIEAAGDVFVAPHAYISIWRATRNPTTMTPTGIGIFLNLAKDDVFTYAVDMATFGVRPNASSPPVRFRKQAYESVNGDPVTTSSELWGDLIRGRLFILTVRSEEYTDNLMESKLNFVTQPDSTSPAVAKAR